MTRRLVETLERALADAPQNFPRDASVLVQFKAGDLADLKDALADAKSQLAPPEHGAEKTTVPDGEEPASDGEEPA